MNTFRELLRQSYTRRVIRILTALHPPALLANRLTLHDVKTHRDPEWETNERAYHDVAIDDINSKVRKYNIHAPPSVRRAYYSRSVEVEKLYEDCAENVLKGLRERVEASNPAGGNMRKVPTEDEKKELIVDDSGFVTFRDMLLGWVDKLLARFRKVR